MQGSRRIFGASLGTYIQPKTDKKKLKKKLWTWTRYHNLATVQCCENMLIACLSYAEDL